MPDPRSDRFVRSHLKTRHLVLLVELGRHGSILHAAQAANLTQPAASKLLGELEHALNVQLFERLPRGVVPTWYGEVMIRRASAALAEMDAAHQEVMELLSGLSGRVAMGTVLTPSAGLVTDAVKLIKSRNARLQRGAFQLALTVSRIECVCMAREVLAQLDAHYLGSLQRLALLDREPSQARTAAQLDMAAGTHVGRYPHLDVAPERQRAPAAQHDPALERVMEERRRA
eukprot:gene22401-biopygen18255